MENMILLVASVRNCPLGGYGPTLGDLNTVAVLPCRFVLFLRDHRSILRYIQTFLARNCQNTTLDYCGSASPLNSELHPRVQIHQ